MRKLLVIVLCTLGGVILGVALGLLMVGGL